MIVWAKHATLPPEHAQDLMPLADTPITAQGISSNQAKAQSISPWVSARARACNARGEAAQEDIRQMHVQSIGPITSIQNGRVHPVVLQAIHQRIHEFRVFNMMHLYKELRAQTMLINAYTSLKGC